MKKLIPMIISSIIFIIFLMIPSQYIDKSFPFKLSERAGTELNEKVFTGRAVQSEMLKRDDFYPIYGSSELGMKDPFHPVHMFEHFHVGKKPFLIGKGGSTDLIHAINIASHAGHIQNKKMAFIISPQWFTKSGLKDDNFGAHYSPLQLQYLFNNRHLSPELKADFAKRLMQFKLTKDEPVIQAYSQTKRLDLMDREISMKGETELELLEKHDVLSSRLNEGISVLEAKKPYQLKGYSWDKLKKQAESYGKKKATNNPYYMRDSYYTKILKHQKKLKRPDEFYSESREFDDLDLLIRTMKETKADPLFILLPTNGLWYDKIGHSEAHREVLYHKIRKVLQQNNMNYYDMTDKEYEPYVMKDAVHIGWKGWVYADEKMINHIKQSR